MHALYASMFAAPSSAMPLRCINSCTQVKGRYPGGAPASTTASPVQGQNSPASLSARIHSGYRAGFTRAQGMPATSPAVSKGSSNANGASFNSPISCIHRPSTSSGSS